MSTSVEKIRYRKKTTESTSKMTKVKKNREADGVRRQAAGEKTAKNKGFFKDDGGQHRRDRRRKRRDPRKSGESEEGNGEKSFQKKGEEGTT